VEQPRAEVEEPGRRWRRIAEDVRQHLSVATPGRAAARVLDSRSVPIRTNIEQLRGRVHQFSGLGPFSLPRPGGAPATADSERDRERPPPFELDATLQQHLERFLKVRLPKIEIHSTPAADRITRRVGADAVTRRNVIYFRQGAFQPATPKGAALLAHEATHVAMAHGARPQRGEQKEERMALANERRLLARHDGLPLVVPSAAPMPPAVAPPPAAPPFVHAATTGRDLDEPDDAAPPPAQLSEPALRSLKADVYRMVLEKIRSDFERGA
jgi:hypothetical protein